MRDVAKFVSRYKDGQTIDLSREMTGLTYEILAQTLFSGEIVGDSEEFEKQVDRLFRDLRRSRPA